MKPTSAVALPDDHREALVRELKAKSVPLPPHIESAFTSVPRETFVSSFEEYIAGDSIGWRWRRRRQSDIGKEAWLNAIYADASLIIAVGASGRTESMDLAPSVLCTMWDMAGIAEGDRVLEMGAASGYSAALLGTAVGCSGSVHTLRAGRAGAEQAQRMLVGTRVSVARVGDPMDGYPSGAPFDCIVACASLPFVPWAWIDQLKVGGTLVMDWRAELGGSLLVLQKGSSEIEGSFDRRVSAALVRLPGSFEAWGVAGGFRQAFEIDVEPSREVPGTHSDIQEHTFSVFFDSELPTVSVRARPPVPGVPAEYVLYDCISGERLTFEPAGEDSVRAIGGSGLAGRVIRAFERFRELSRPVNQRFRYRVTPKGQYVTLEHDYRTLEWTRILRSAT